MFRRVIVQIIKIYQFFFSFDHGLPGKILPNYRVCRFFPSCSEYAIESFQTYGTIKGLILSIRRIIRCTPLTPAGTYDPVPSKEVKIRKK